MNVSVASNQILIEGNDKANQSFFERFTDYTVKTSGSQRVLSVVKSAAKLRNIFGKTYSSVAHELERAATASSSAIGLVRLPAVTKDAYDSIMKVKEDDGAPVAKKTTIAVRDALEAVTSWCNIGVFFGSNPLLKHTAQIADFGSDAADLCLSVDDYQLAATYEASADGEVKEAFTHTRKYHMIRVAKAVLAFAGAVFAMIALVTGLKLLPVALAAILSLATTLVAIRRDFFKDEGKYKLVDLTQPASLI